MTARRNVTYALVLSLFALVACSDVATEQAENELGAMSETAYQSMDPEPAVLDTVRCVSSPTASCTIDPVQDGALAESDTWVLARGTLYRIDSTGAVSVGARSGGGPGEVRAPIAIGESADARGGTTVFDIANARLSTFSATDSAVGTSVMPPPFFRSMRVRSGALHAYTLPPAQAIGDTVSAAILRYNVQQAGWSDTVARFVDRAVSVQGSGGQVLARLPWERVLLWDVCGNGEIVTAFSDGWTVRRFRAGAANASDSLYRPAHRVEPMSDEEHAALSAQALETAPPLPAFKEALAKRLAEKPATRPSLDQLFCTGAGNIVVVNRPARGAADRIVDVLAADGTVQRRTRVPNTVRLLGAYGERLVGVQESEEGGSGIVRIDLATQPAAQR